MLDLLEEEGQTALALHTPLDSLVARYRQQKADIERIAAYVRGETDVMGYFLNGARIEHRVGNFTATALFDVGPAIRSLDAFYWSQAMQLTDCLELMPAGMRNEWNAQISDNKTPPFEPESVRATLETMISQRASFFAERYAVSAQTPLPVLALSSRSGNCAPSWRAASVAVQVRISPWRRSMPTWFL